MLKKIRIRGFQSHENTELVLDSGINILLGSSDTGKSSIYRAIQWVALNKPSGWAFRSHWAKETIVEIWTTDGHHIVRQKTASKNLYKIDGEELKAFGTGAPDEVTAPLGLEPINLQGQRDRAFLIDDNEGQIAKTINRYTHMDDIDKATTSISGEVRKQAEKVRSLQEHLDSIKKSLKHDRFKGFDKLVTKALKLRTKSAEVTEKQERLTLLKGLVSEYKSLQKQKIDTDVLARFKLKAEKLLTLFDKQEGLCGKLKGLEELRQSRNKIKQEINSSTERLAVLEEQKSELLKDRCPVCKQRIKHG